MSLCSTDRTEDEGAAAAIRYREGQRRRWELRDDLATVTGMDRIRACGRRRTGDDGVKVKTIGDHPYFTGVQTCGSAWVCPVCTYKVRIRRAAQIEAGVRFWIKGGGGVLFVTFTAPHDLGDRLAWLVEGLAKSFRELNAGRKRKAQRDAYGIKATIRALEITYGESGWHPHLHVLYFLAAPLTATAHAALVDEWKDVWARRITAHGMRRPGAGVGIVSRRVTGGDQGGGLGDYLAKLGMEISAPDTKTGRKASSVTPFGVLRRALDGESSWVKLWHEYEAATKARKSIAFSRGAYALLGIDQVTDEEIAAEDVGGVEVLDVPAYLWDRSIAPIPGRRLELLERVGFEGLEGGRRLLEDWSRRPVLRRTG